MVEATTLDQIAALKDGRIDVGFGRIRFEDPSVRRIILRNEKLVAAFPVDHPLATGSGPISLRDLADEPQIIYPARPTELCRRVISLFRDHSIEPRIVHEARELQIAIGLVAAQEEAWPSSRRSVRRARSHDVAFRELVEPATSPSS
jgi:DNA-binding transcriptional LysR family regulator